jgi:hypothetical protein
MFKPVIKGKSVFIISVIVIIVICISVYFTGVHAHRTISQNYFISLSIISFWVFAFLSFCLFKGFSIVNNFYKFKDFKTGDFIPYPKVSTVNSIGEFIDLDIDDGCFGAIVTYVLWFLVSVFVVVMLVFLDFAIWFSLFIILIALYWVFLRAIRIVLRKSRVTQGDIVKSLTYGFLYTLLYTGWLYGVVIVADYFRS